VGDWAGNDPFGTAHSLIETWNGAAWTGATEEEGEASMVGTSCSRALLCVSVGGGGGPDSSPFAAATTTYGQVLQGAAVGVAADEGTGGYREVGADGAAVSFAAPYFGSIGD
jgi:hypothetical protein